MSNIYKDYLLKPNVYKVKFQQESLKVAHLVELLTEAQSLINDEAFLRKAKIACLGYSYGGRSDVIKANIQKKPDPEYYNMLTALSLEQGDIDRIKATLKGYGYTPETKTFEEVMEHIDKSGYTVKNFMRAGARRIWGIYQK